MFKILLVEDDLLLSNMETQLLSQNGYEVVNAYSGSEALMLLKDNNYDLMLLDLMLPGVSGENVLIKAREICDIPIIVISAKSDMQSKLSLLKNGADDYLTKPFENEELLVRIETVLRRYSKNTNVVNTLLTYKDLSLDTLSLKVLLNEVPLSLTRYEFLILQLLMTQPSRVYTKNNIFENVWGEDFVGDDNAINVHIGNLRKKFATVNQSEQYITTVWGLGFKME